MGGGAWEVRVGAMGLGLAEQSHLSHRWRPPHLSWLEVTTREGWDSKARLGDSAMQKYELNRCKKAPQVLAWKLPQ